MKLRRQPEDFEVIERSALPVGRAGAFAVYELHKIGWTTLDAIDRISRILEIPRRNIEHAGLKDRHAITSQRITIKDGPRRSFEEGPISLSYLGQSPRPVRSDDILENAFKIVLRSLTDAERATAERSLPEIQKSGIPNYFDDQRFGSWFPDYGFIADAWLREDYEKALHLAFAEPEHHDSPDEREQKEILRENWGNWIQCKALLSRSHRRSIVTYLCDHPTNFKGVWATVNGDLRGLYLSALQSDLWNRIVSRTFENICPPEQRAELMLKTGPLWVPRDCSEESRKTIERLTLPLPSTRVKLEDYPDPALVESVLAERGWTLPTLKVKFPRDRFFSRAQRPMMIFVNDLSGEFGEDEFAQGKHALTLRFRLKSGAYATMLTKRLLLNSDSDIESDA